MISEKLSTDSRRMLQKGVPQFVGFCRCTPCRQRRGKASSSLRRSPAPSDAPRAGSAEAKPVPRPAASRPCAMHPVQAAPRQSLYRPAGGAGAADAPRAGSAEAKPLYDACVMAGCGCTPCRQHRGKERYRPAPARRARCTPCRQRRGKAGR